MKAALGQPLRVALYNGIVLERDAVSMSFLRKLRLLQRLRDEGCDHVSGSRRAATST